MGKKDKKRDKKKDVVAKLPKKKCCESKDRCNRCPLRMLKEGTLPEGYTVRHRKLVKVEGEPVKVDLVATPGKKADKDRKKSKAA